MKIKKRDVTMLSKTFNVIEWNKIKMIFVLSVDFVDQHTFDDDD